MDILFLQTGGTIDKDYPSNEDNHGYSFSITEPAFNRILERVNPSFSFKRETVLKKDSLDITDEDRRAILQACRDSTEQRIIITHGTDTMLKTAELLSEVSDKTIVLTGAMLPELFKNSDADFNIGVAVSAVSYMKPGVYIAMNGRVLSWNQVIFDKQTSRFVEK